MNIENVGGRDQSRVKIKFKKFEKLSPFPKTYQKSHNDDNEVCAVGLGVGVYGWGDG